MVDASRTDKKPFEKTGVQEKTDKPCRPFQGFYHSFLFPGWAKIDERGKPTRCPFFVDRETYQRSPPPPPLFPPRPPPPPPPPPSRFPIGLASLTTSVRPSSCVPFSASIAFCASPPELISTKPKPRDCPVNLSEITFADSTVPCAAKISCNRPSVTE